MPSSEPSLDIIMSKMMFETAEKMKPRLETKKVQKTVIPKKNRTSIPKNRGDSGEHSLMGVSLLSKEKKIQPEMKNMELNNSCSRFVSES